VGKRGVLSERTGVVKNAAAHEPIAPRAPELLQEKLHKSLKGTPTRTDCTSAGWSSVSLPTQQRSVRYGRKEEGQEEGRQEGRQEEEVKNLRF
jgi:hypothetical protein